MSVVSRSFSAIGKLIIVGVLLAVFLASMAGVVYMSLSGAEVKVPDITGKDFVESEKELAALGLKIKKRADRPTPDKINTVLEQLPKAGETVKTGQMILVVVSKLGGDGETPDILKKDIEKDDTEKIEEMISDKPKKSKANSNSNVNKKKADTTRDVIANTASSDANDSGSPKSGDDTKTDTPASDPKPGDKGNKSDAPRPQNSPAASKPNTVRQPGAEPRSRP